MTNNKDSWHAKVIMTSTKYLLKSYLPILRNYEKTKFSKERGEKIIWFVQSEDIFRKVRIPNVLHFYQSQSNMVNLPKNNKYM